MQAQEGWWLVDTGQPRCRKAGMSCQHISQQYEGPIVTGSIMHAVKHPPVTPLSLTEKGAA
jgi:hypothetical protein